MSAEENQDPTVPIFTAKTADQAWQKAAIALARKDLAVQASRAGPTRELLHAIIAFSNPRERWVVSRMPALNPAFAIAEVLWIMAGRRDAQMLVFFNRKLPEFAGHSDEYHGAYGFRIRSAFGLDQLKRAYEVLSANPDSRQVVLQIWSAELDLPGSDGAPANADVPCNLVSIIKIRDGKLHWTQVLRSNDLVLGVPHNFIQFTTLQEVLAGWLDVGLGQYTHMADSLHVYERDLNSVQPLYSGRTFPSANTDSLAAPYTESLQIWGELERYVDTLTNQNSSRPQALSLVDSYQAPQAYVNLFAILAAEASRRRGWTDVSNQAIRRCSNSVLLYAWENWLKRTQGA